MGGSVFVQMSNGMTVLYPLEASNGTTTIVPLDDGSLSIELVSAATRSGDNNILIGYFNPGTWNCAHISIEEDSK